MPRPAGDPAIQFQGDIDKTTALADTRHDFDLDSQDTAITSGVGDATQFDCFKNFANSIQRIVLFGDAAPEQKAYSKRLTSSCKGTGVMRSGPEDALVKYCERLAGIPPTPDNFLAATIADFHRDNTVPSGGWSGNSDATGVAIGPIVAGTPVKARGFLKKLVAGGRLGHGYPTDRQLADARALVAGQAAERRRGRAPAPVSLDEARRLVAMPDAYDAYHREIATILGWREGGNPIPVIVDTSRTLQNKSDPYFLICRPRECVADPSKTSIMRFPLIASEIVAAGAAGSRVYPIYNNVIHTVSGTLSAPIIQYNIDGRPYQYNFGGEGSKPNEIEVCKGKIKQVIGSITTAATAAGTGIDYYQTPIAPPGMGPRVARLAALFDNTCAVYDMIQYKDVINTSIKDNIALPFIAKRGGDQLQVLCCKETIKYNVPEQAGILVPGPYNITNCVFWTIDRVAAIFAVQQGITTVLQLPTKDCIIYLRGEYASNIVAAAAGGAKGAPYKPAKNDRNKPKPSGRELQRRLEKFELRPSTIRTVSRPLSPAPPRMCTRADMAAALTANTNISDNCFLRLLEEQCDPSSIYYNPFIFLNVVNFYLNTTHYAFNLKNNPFNILAISKQLELSLDNCIGVEPAENADGSYPPFINNPDGTYLVNFNITVGAVLVPITIRRTAAINNTIAYDVSGITGIVSMNGAGGVLSKIAVIDETQIQYFRYLNGTPRQNMMGGGPTFYDNWKSLQGTFDMKAANNLFLDFIKLLSICENQYFIHKDSADNFYIYNSYTPVRTGGSTQIELMSFLHSLITKYISSVSNSADLNKFLRMFVYFPIFMYSIQFNNILSDLHAFIGSWFEYIHVMDYAPESVDGIYELFLEIIRNTIAGRTRIQNEMPSSFEKCANYLSTVFPHGYFNIQHNILLDKQKDIIIVNTSVAMNANMITKAPTKYKNGDVSNSNATLSINGYASNATQYASNEYAGPPIKRGRQGAPPVGMVIGGARKKHITQKKLAKRHTQKRNHNKKHTKKRIHRRHTKKLHKNK